MQYHDELADLKSYFDGHMHDDRFDDQTLTFIQHLYMLTYIISIQNDSFHVQEPCLYPALVRNQFIHRAQESQVAQVDHPEDRS